MFIRKYTKRCKLCGGEMKLCKYQFGQHFLFGTKEPAFEIWSYYLDGLGEPGKVYHNGKRSNVASFSMLHTDIQYATHGYKGSTGGSPGTKKFIEDKVLYEWLKIRIKGRNRYAHQDYDCEKCKSSITVLMDKELQPRRPRKK